MKPRVYKLGEYWFCDYKSIFFSSVRTMRFKTWRETIDYLKNFYFPFNRKDSNFFIL